MKHMGFKELYTASTASYFFSGARSYMHWSLVLLCQCKKGPQNGCCQKGECFPPAIMLAIEMTIWTRKSQKLLTQYIMAWKEPLEVPSGCLCHSFLICKIFLLLFQSTLLYLGLHALENKCWRNDFCQQVLFCYPETVSISQMLFYDPCEMNTRF